MTPISPFFYCQCICYVSPISNLELAFKAIISQCQEGSPTWVIKVLKFNMPRTEPSKFSHTHSPSIQGTKFWQSSKLLTIFSPHPWLVICLILTSNTHLFYHHCYNLRSDARLLYSAPLFPLDWNSCLKSHLASLFCPLCYEPDKNYNISNSITLSYNGSPFSCGLHTFYGTWKYFLGAKKKILFFFSFFNFILSNIIL